MPHAFTFTPTQVDETPDQGWEERTDASVTHLLKTALSKDGNKEARATSNAQLTRPADASKLKKHITLVADRLHKGLRPTRDGPPPAASAAEEQSAAAET